MRKVILFNMMTLDGFFEGPGREIDWHNVDAEFNTFAIDQLDAADLLLFGRVTYEMMASYWPTSQATTDDQVVAGKMNAIAKIVFSKTLKNASWNNTRLVKDHAAEEILKLKAQPGKDILIFGSAGLAATLTAPGLIDEYRVMLNPLLLGSGTPLFQGLQPKLKLKLLRARTFASGNVLLVYQPLGAQPSERAS